MDNMHVEGAPRLLPSAQEVNKKKQEGGQEELADDQPAQESVKKSPGTAAQVKNAPQGASATTATAVTGACPHGPALDTETWMLEIPAPQVQAPDNPHLFEHALEALTGQVLPAALFHAMSHEVDQSFFQAQQRAQPSSAIQRSEEQRGRGVTLDGTEQVNMEGLGLQMALNNLQTFKAELQTNAELMTDNTKAQNALNQQSLKEYEEKVQEAEAQRNKAQKGFWGRLFSGLLLIVTAAVKFLTLDFGGAVEDYAKAVSQIAGPDSPVGKKIADFLSSKFMKALQITSYVVMGLVTLSGVGGALEAVGEAAAKFGSLCVEKGLMRAGGEALEKGGAKLASLGSRISASPMNFVGRTKDLMKESGIFEKAAELHKKIGGSKWLSSGTKRGASVQTAAQLSSTAVTVGTDLRREKYMGKAKALSAEAEAELAQMQSKIESFRSVNQQLQRTMSDRSDKAGETLKQAQTSLSGLARTKADIISKGV